MAHTRNGKAAKTRRQDSANDRRKASEQHFRYYDQASEKQQLAIRVFGQWEKCDECLSAKLIGSDCNTPHCKRIREEHLGIHSSW